MLTILLVMDVQSVKFLLEKERNMKRNAINKNGSTAMDVCDKGRDDDTRKEIYKSLKFAKVLRGKDALEPESERGKLEENRSGLMVVASLIATMAFQVGVNPPGGVWQDNKEDTRANLPFNATNLAFKANSGHIAGVSVMAHQAARQYINLMIMNSVAVVSSLSVILLLIGGLTCNRLFVRVLRTTMWIAITAITLTYASSIVYLSSDKVYEYKIPIAIDVVWALIMCALLYTHARRFDVIKQSKDLYHRYYSGPETANPSSENTKESVV